MKKTSCLIVLAAVIGLFVWFFANALFGGGMFCFRDAAHYYYPLFQFITDEWAAGQVPLWNPYENLGQPLAADATSSVFYPGKLIFALPLLSYAWAYKLYIMAHLLLAAWAAYRLARHFSASVEAAGVCAISYAFSGNVLMQYCNVVFLVGAAWLPVAMLAADRMLTEGRGARGQGTGRMGWAVIFGAVLALMVLGGDPQMAYNAGLLAAMYALWLWWESRGNAAARVGLLALAAATALIFSAVQVLPSIEFAQHSDRTTGQITDRLLGRFEPGSHSEHIYHFSVGPWRLAEYVWPNLAGKQFPIHRRWLEVLPAEGRIWTPSLYMGILPLLLALSVMRFRGRGTRRASTAAKQNPSPIIPPTTFLSWSVVLAVAASFGWYGLGWLMHELHIAPGIGAPFGGLYWLMTVLLPGYAWFRYPAKLLVVAALGLSVLSALGWDRAFAGRSDRFRHVLLWVGGLSICWAIAALAIRPFWAGWLSGVESDVLFGPLDTSGAWCDLLGAFLQTAALCGVFWWLLGKRSRWVPAAALLLVAVDLAVANRWMVACAPARQWQEKSELAAAIERAKEEPCSGGACPARLGHGNAGQARPLHEKLSRLPYRVFRHSIWLPPAWKQSGSPARLAEAMRWDRDTLWPKYNLADRIALVEVHGTMMLHDYRPLHHFLLAEYVILPGDKVLQGGQRIEVAVEDVSLWYNPQHLPRAWINRRLCPRTESCRVVSCDLLRVEIEAELIRPGMVVLCDQFYPGWKLEVETAGRSARPVPILRTNRVMRGAWLPAGKHRLVYYYRPASFFWGTAISSLGWLGLLGFLICLRVSSKTRDLLPANLPRQGP